MHASRCSGRGAIVLDTDKILLLAVVLFCGALRMVGPIAMDDEDLDLGGGISMAPDGQIRMTNKRPVAPMRIPDDAEIGISEHASSEDGSQH
jgi:hypothetical protein